MKAPINQASGGFNASVSQDKGVGAVRVRVNMYYHAHGGKTLKPDPEKHEKQGEKRGRLENAPKIEYHHHEIKMEKKIMAKVSQETLKKLNDFLDSLPSEAQSKCSLCNETLVHLVKTAEVETGAGTATVTRELANRINDGAAPGDKVSGNALRNRVQNAEGIKCSDRADKQEPKPKPKECPVCGSVYPCDHKHCPNGCEKAAVEKPDAYDARHFCFQAAGNLRSIPKDDANKVTELTRVFDFLIGQIRESGDVGALADCANKLVSYIDHKRALGLAHCSRKLSTEDRDNILFKVEKLYPGKNDGWKRACALNEVGLKCGKKKDSPWTPTEVRNNLRHAKIRQDAKTGKE